MPVLDDASAYPRGRQTTAYAKRSEDGLAYDCQVTTWNDEEVPGGLFISKWDTIHLRINLLSGGRVKNILALDDSEESVRCERTSLVPVPLKRMLERDGVDFGYESDDPPVHVLEKWEREESFPC
jgi:hypothetical protein